MATPALSTIPPARVCIRSGRAREPHQTWTERASSKYLYDEVGSALFETICVLPEYGLTRADARLLEKHAGEIVGRLPSPIQVAELGSGSGKKTRWILEALSRRPKDILLPHRDFAFGAGRVVERTRANRSGQHRWVRTAIPRRIAYCRRRASGGGSSVRVVSGQYHRQFRSRCGRKVFAGNEGDSPARGRVVARTDLEKSIELQLLAYDDPAGVTAAFNLNLLARNQPGTGRGF